MRFLQFLIIYFLLFVPVSNCNQSESYYLLFAESKGKMRSYHNSEKYQKTFTYYPESSVSWLFYVKKNGDKFLEKSIKSADTFGLGVKTYDWLNRFDNIKRDSFLYRKPKKNFFIIEKDTLTGTLKLFEVDFRDEIE
jgi:hypothetical protein